MNKLLARKFHRTFHSCSWRVKFKLFNFQSDEHSSMMILFRWNQWSVKHNRRQLNELLMFRFYRSSISLMTFWFHYRMEFDRPVISIIPTLGVSSPMLIHSTLDHIVSEASINELSLARRKVFIKLRDITLSSSQSKRVSKWASINHHYTTEN